MAAFELPAGLEPLRGLKIWVCHPLIWNPKKHNHVGGYDKPPINPYTLRDARTNEEQSRSTFDEAVAQIGKAAQVSWHHDGVTERLDVTVAGVGIALAGTGIRGLDLDNVVDMDRKKMTHEAGDIMRLMQSYCEVSPSGTGMHILFMGSLPEGMYKKTVDGRADIFGTNRAEYQLFESGYMTLSGDTFGGYEIAERSAEAKQLYDTYFEPNFRRHEVTTTSSPSPVVSCGGSGYSYGRWLQEVQRLDDDALLDAIFKSPKVGARVKALYNGDMSDYNNDHSRADQALATYLYSFTSDRARMIDLFKKSRLFDDYQRRHKGRRYLELTFSKAERDSEKLVGHFEFTKAEKREYAQQKQAEEQRRKDGQKRFHL